MSLFAIITGGSVELDLPLRLNEDIQGDVLAGFKKDQMVLLFVKFEEAAKARAWLQRLTPRIATNKQVAAFNKAFSDARKRSGGEPTGLKATWLSVSFTYPGIKKLIGNKEPYPEADESTTFGAFQQGASARADWLNDKGDSAPEGWVFGNHKSPDSVHAVLTIASDTMQDLDAAVIEQREAAAQSRITIVFQQNCATLPGSRRGKEHFGFKDGVSEPGVRDFDEPDPLMDEWVKDHPGTRLIPAGEFVLGHPFVDPPVRPRPEVPAWAFNGSFHVVRRLAQDVPGWWAQIARQLPVLKDKKVIPQEATAEWVAARVVGRWRSGTPVHKCPYADQPFNTVAANDNLISYADDRHGYITPLFSHLRKTNPRDGLWTSPAPDAEPEKENPVMDRRRIMRRGNPYGQPFDPAAEEPGNGPDAPRGLLFVSYQSDLVDQFEFIQKSWIDSVKFPPRDKDEKRLPGPDAMVGINGEVTWEHPDTADKDAVKLSLTRFVRTEGAVYAFAPSITVLRELSEGRLPDKHQPEIGQPVDTFLPVPDMQQVKGKSWYWVFRTVGGKQLFRVISIADGMDHTDKLEKPDQPISEFDSFTDVDQVDLLLPFPDAIQVNGKTFYWVFHSRSGKQLYRVISIADGSDHVDRRERQDAELIQWKSLEGVSKLDCVLPVPDMQQVKGKRWYWVFHTVGSDQLYRVISIADGERHEDRLEQGDQRIADFDCFKNIDRITTILPIPDMQRVKGVSLYWVFHRDQYRIIEIADGSDHVDRVVVDDRPVTLWQSLTAR